MADPGWPYAGGALGAVRTRGCTLRAHTTCALLWCAVRRCVPQTAGSTPPTACGAHLPLPTQAERQGLALVGGGPQAQALDGDGKVQPLPEARDFDDEDIDVDDMTDDADEPDEPEARAAPARAPLAGAAAAAARGRLTPEYVPPANLTPEGGALTAFACARATPCGDRSQQHQLGSSSTNQAAAAAASRRPRSRLVQAPAGRPSSTATPAGTPPPARAQTLLFSNRRGRQGGQARAAGGAGAVVPGLCGRPPGRGRGAAERGVWAQDPVPGGAAAGVFDTRCRPAGAP